MTRLWTFVNLLYIHTGNLETETFWFFFFYLVLSLLSTGDTIQDCLQDKITLIQYPSKYTNYTIYMCMWAATWQNQQSERAPSEDSDQPGHPPSLIRVFACAQWVAKGPRFLHADSEDSDQTGRMPRLIWVFAGRTLTLLGLVMSRLI